MKNGIACNEIACFGGSFDPPHNGHLAIIKKALEILQPQKLFLIPTFLNPFKANFYFSPQKRLEWLYKLYPNLSNSQLSNSQIEILDFEIRQNKPTPTIQTIDFITKTYQPTKIFLLLGADNLAKLPLWDSYDLLKTKVEFVIIPRLDYKIPEYFRILPLVPLDISSTHIRALIAEKNPKVLDFIPEILHDEIKTLF